jgi:hypothetical protein
MVSDTQRKTCLPAAGRDRDEYFDRMAQLHDAVRSTGL